MATLSVAISCSANGASCGAQTNSSWNSSACVGGTGAASWSLTVQASAVASIPNGSRITRMQLSFTPYTDSGVLYTQADIRTYLQITTTSYSEKKLPIDTPDTWSINHAIPGDTWSKGETGTLEVGTIIVYNNEDFYSGIHYLVGFGNLTITYEPPVSGFFPLGHNS